MVADPVRRGTADASGAPEPHAGAPAVPAADTAARLRAVFGQWTPRAVVFDCDGLLLDTESVWEQTQARVIRERGAVLTAADRAELHGSTLERAAEIIAARSGGDEPGARTRLHEVFDEHLALGIRPMPGAAEVVAAAAARVPIACASNAWLEALRFKLDAAGLLELFTLLEASDTVERPKPAPDMYAAAARGLGVEPAEALALEDSATGARAAVSAGLRLLAVPGPSGRIESADLTLTTLDDRALLEWIATW